MQHAPPRDGEIDIGGCEFDGAHLAPRALAREDGLAIQMVSRQIADSYGLIKPDWNGFNVLHRAGGRMGALLAGFVPGQGGYTTDGILYASKDKALDALYLLNADDIDMAGISKNTFVIYQGHHGDAGAQRADVILPGAAYTEKNATYVNTEGRVQRARQAAFPPRADEADGAKEDWKIIRALSETLGHALPFDNLMQLRQQMAEAQPAFAKVDEVAALAWLPFAQNGTQVALSAANFEYPVTNFYMTDVISRHSETMAKCTAELLHPMLEAAE